MKAVSIALAGMPNVGKSTVFNALTGLRQHTGNWAGKTVATAQGRFSTARFSYTVTDLPGAYSLSARSAEEEVAFRCLCEKKPDAVVAVCDAACLERNLLLVLQLAELCPRVIVCVNLMDEAKRKGIRLDLPLISERLGLPVVGVTARKKESLRPLLDVLDAAACGKAEFGYRAEPLSQDVEIARSELAGALKKAGLYSGCESFVSLLLLEGDTGLIRGRQLREVSEHLRRDLAQRGFAAEALKDAAAASLVKRSEKICAGSVIYEAKKASLPDRRIDKVLTGRLWGYPVMFVLLLLVFWLTVSGANYPSELLQRLFSAGEAGISRVWKAAHLPKALYGPLVSGVYRTVGTVISVMLPPMAIFFPLFTFLEDLGYLPRMAFNLDRPFAKCSACGKQALTMCMGFGCNAVGVTGCRIIRSPRERLLAMLTNSFVPCNGRFPSLIAIITLYAGGRDGFVSALRSALALSGVIVLGVLATLGATKLLSATVLKGVPSAFTLELPSYRRPQPLKILLRSIPDRTLFVLGRAAAVAAPAGLVIWYASNICVNGVGLLEHLCAFLDPVGRIMGLDGVVLAAFILGFPANEIVLPIMLSAYLGSSAVLQSESPALLREALSANGWTRTTALCFVFFCLLHWPCSTTLLTVKKESGSLRWTFLAALLPTVFGFALCVLANLIAKIFF